jgi:MFS family permease
MSPPPLASSYPAKIALVLVALCPFIAVTTATTLLQTDLQRDLHTTTTALSLADGLSNAGYAFGAVLAVALLKRFPPRPLFLSYESLLLAGSVVAAAAPSVTVLAVGRVVEGFATGLLLVAALPPLVTRFDAGRLPVTVAVVDVGLFGATTVGPLIGGLAGVHDAWRLVFVAVGILGAAGLGLGFLSVEQGEPLDPDGPLDLRAIGLAAAGTFLPFFATSELAGHPVDSWWVLPALAVGLVALASLLVREYRHDHPLTPLKLLAHTFPITGVVAAMVSGAAAVAVLDLAQTFLVDVQHTGVLSAGLLFWPQVAAIAVAAAVLGALFRSQWVPTLVIVGTLVLGAGAVTMARLGPSSGHLAILLVAVTIGFGAGATVSPGLFIAALSCPSSELGPTFALVELLRSEAAFVLAPVALYVAMGAGSSPTALTHGIRTASWAVVVLLAGGLVVCVGLWLLGGVRPQRPNLEAWIDDGDEALHSPPTAAAVR